MHPPTQVLLHFLKLGLHSLPHGGPFQRKVTAGPGDATLVRKPEERKREVGPSPGIPDISLTQADGITYRR